MLSRDFLGIPSIQEVECWGGYLEAEVKVFSLTLFKMSDSTMLSHVNPFTGECITSIEFSSCHVDSGNTRNSRLRILVTDLDEEDSKHYGCNVTSFKSVGETPRTVTWSLTVKRSSEFYIYIHMHTFTISSNFLLVFHEIIFACLSFFF